MRQQAVNSQKAFGLAKAENIEFRQDKTESTALCRDQDDREALSLVLQNLDEQKANDIAVFSPHSYYRCSTDSVVVASGRSTRHVEAIVTSLLQKLKASNFGGICVEGLPYCNWAVVSVHDVVIHIFCPEVRDYYQIEELLKKNKAENIMREEKERKTKKEENMHDAL